MRWLIVVALAACYSPRGTRCEPCSGIAECPGGLACISGTCQEAAGACEARDDSGTEAMPADAASCFGERAAPFFDICPPMIAAPYTMPATIDTASPSTCTFMLPADASINRPAVCVIAAARITGTGVTRVIGNLPLVLYGAQQIALTSLDLAGHNDDSSTRPPAAAANLCMDTNGVDGSSGSGGAGATFRARGGQSGAGNGAASAQSTTTLHDGKTLRGGCRGGKGGVSNTAIDDAGAGGNGGGAIYILSPMIMISGRINASGGGAILGGLGGGGGGGGSGGMVLIWSNNPITITGLVMALGGGGGAGGGVASGNALPGDDPGAPNDPAMPTAPSVATAGSGGAGGSSSAFAGGTGMAGSTGGGGGGGGSTGFIYVRPMQTGPMFGPPPD